MRSARTVTIGGFGGTGSAVLGGGFPVLVQTMWKDRLSLSDCEKRGGEIVERIDRLARMGCGLLRFAVPDPASAEAVGALASMVSMPLSADIHFDYK
ncbi:MAG: flavodoxin-dependent (E)-4-hydroxy-3-methylbut-2-enyl-diphosphate synthase, partial [Treponema sp.]|nr:flavodoxin-dependent (E)-4-hydroxy-3-methylbut-2-enyl-diphosphate synthase [Treponema sp.]